MSKGGYAQWRYGCVRRNRPIHRLQCLPSWPPGAAMERGQTVIFYVAPWGDDVRTGLLPEAPLATVAQAEKYARLAQAEGIMVHIVVFGEA